MSLLATLRAKKQNREVATLTVATSATHEGVKTPTVARVATVSVAWHQEMPCAANDPVPPAPVTAPDLWCWPYTQVMNTTELGTFMARLSRFTDKGLSHDDAERLADALVIRDRDGDDRRLCFECAYLQGVHRWRCGNWQLASVSREGLGLDLVRLMQRCGGFKVAAFSATNFQMISENLFAQGN